MLEKIENIITVLFIVGLICIIIYLNNKVEFLTRKEDELRERIHFEQVDDLEMLPCSICGGEGRLFDVGNSPRKYYVKCIDCDYETYTYSTVQEAIDKWNYLFENNSRQN